MIGGYDRDRNPTGYSKEHGIPKWLLAHINVSSQILTEKVTRVDLDENGFKGVTKAERDLRNHTRTFKRVCGDCNTGWMADLENQARPILIPLIDGNRTVNDLNSEEREVISKWALKTAFFTLDGRSNNVYVPNEHIRHLWRNQALPNDVALFGMTHREEASLAFYGGKDWITNVPCEHLEVSGNYKVSFVFRQLLLTVVYWPLKGWSFGLRDNMHTLVWPSKANLILMPWTYPPDGPLLLYTFHMSLAISNANTWPPARAKFNLPGGLSVDCYEHERLLFEYNEAIPTPWNREFDQ
jgi:hypothetical protein